MGVQPDARRVKDLGGEVAAEEAPDRAVGGGADGALVFDHDLLGDGWRRTVCENGAVLD